MLGKLLRWTVGNSSTSTPPFSALYTAQDLHSFLVERGRLVLNHTDLTKLFRRKRALPLLDALTLKKNHCVQPFVLTSFCMKSS